MNCIEILHKLKECSLNIGDNEDMTISVGEDEINAVLDQAITDRQAILDAKAVLPDKRILKHDVYNKCIICGADDGLHQAETDKCPHNGIWADTIFTPYDTSEIHVYNKLLDEITPIFARKNIAIKQLMNEIKLLKKNENEIAIECERLKEVVQGGILVAERLNQKITELEERLK